MESIVCYNINLMDVLLDAELIGEVYFNVSRNRKWPRPFSLKMGVVTSGYEIR